MKAWNRGGTRTRIRVRRVTRRKLLHGFAAAGMGALLAACGGDGSDLDPFSTPGPAGGGGGQDAQTGAGESRQAAPQVAPAGGQQVGQQAGLQTGQGVGQAQGAPAAEGGEGQGEARVELPEPKVYVMPQPLRQGKALLVLVEAPGALASAVTWQGEAFALLREGDRFFGFIGVEAVAPPGPAALSVGVWDGEWNQLLAIDAFIEIVEVEWTSDDIQVDEANLALLDPEVRAYDVEVRRPFQSGLTPERLWSGVFEAPVPDGRITALYGELRSFNGGPITDYHSGIDYGGAIGDPIVAANAGVVSWAGRTDRRGNGVIVDHGAGVYSGYYHLVEAMAESGAEVSRGEVIGLMGATGLATGPHLHWELVVRGVTVDPIPWIREREVPDPLGDPDPGTLLEGVNQASRPSA